MKAGFVHAYELTKGDRDFWKGCQLLETLKVVGEGAGMAAVGVEVPVHSLSCPAVTRSLGSWVWGESRGPRPRGPVCAQGQAGISQQAKLFVLTPEPMYSAWVGKSSLILSFLIYGSLWRREFCLSCLMWFLWK